jgi:(S)-2-hydroxyglutarate dehydrogenase
MSSTYDVAVVGGGIVGVASAASLAARGLRVVVLEAADRLAGHQSGHNSGVIHAGLYYRPGSLKARLCTEGREALYRFLEAEAIPHRRCGKLVVATRERDVPALDELERRGRANGLSGLKRLTAAALKDYEPEVRGIAGLWVAETGVVDYALVTEAYARRAAAHGVEILLGARVLGIAEDGGRLRVQWRAGEVNARFLLNCAGLHADRVASLAGAEPGVRIIPFRGEYYDLRPERASAVRGLIYPVPNPALPFLGVHLSRTVNDQVHAGPNAVLALSREGYSRRTVSGSDLLETISYPGFWRMARRQWRNGVTELRRSFSKRLFVRSIQELVPAIGEADVVRGGSGVRAQAVDSSGRLVDDFHLVDSSRGLHVLNAPSPAATASLAIGRTIASRVIERLG